MSNEETVRNFTQESYININPDFLNKCKIINSNFLDITLEPESIDLIVTSPPYNVGVEYDGYIDNLSLEEYLLFAKKWITKCFKAAKKGTRLCINVPFMIKIDDEPVNLEYEYTKTAVTAGWTQKAMIVWCKGGAKNSTAWGSFQSASSPNFINVSEAILIFYKDEWKREGTKEQTNISKKEYAAAVKNVWFLVPAQQTKGHPAVFPESLPRRLIELLSFENDLVLDPFVGSGTTAQVSLATKRRFIGTEISKKYTSLAFQRAKEVYNQTRFNEKGEIYDL